MTTINLTWIGKRLTQNAVEGDEIIVTANVGNTQPTSKTNTPWIQSGVESGQGQYVYTVTDTDGVLLKTVKGFDQHPTQGPSCRYEVFPGDAAAGAKLDASSFTAALGQDIQLRIQVTQNAKFNIDASFPLPGEAPEGSHGGGKKHHHP